MKPASISKPWFGLLCTALSLLSGCSVQVYDVYGESDGYPAKSSPAGMSIFRALVESNDFETITIRSLSPGSKERLNTIVWCPDAFPNHRKSTLDWMEQWLATGNKTLVYIGRDYSPHADYWTEIAQQQGKSASARSKWIAALDRAADARNKLDAKRRMARTESVMPWCVWRSQGGTLQTVPRPEGPWSEGIPFENAHISVRSSAAPVRSSDLADIIRRIEAIPEPWKGNSTGAKAPAAGEPYATFMTESDRQQLEIANSITAQEKARWTTVLSDANQIPLISRIDIDPISQSQVIVVCNNSMFCNYSMLNPSHRQLAARMIEAFPAGGVGFLTGAEDPRIRTDNYDERQKGFEMLTTWPLNVVTIHAAFLGIAAIIAAYPIFGRPKRLRKESSADFGMHIEAIGSLMESSGDIPYARKQIADYFRNVRKDPTSAWANTDPSESATQSPFRTSDADAKGNQ